MTGVTLYLSAMYPSDLKHKIISVLKLHGLRFYNGEDNESVSKGAINQAFQLYVVISSRFGLWY